MVRTLSRTIYYPARSTLFRLYHLTDLHVGAKACHETFLKRDIALIERNPNALWMGGGDYIDAICRKGDRRYDENSVATWLHDKRDIMGAQRDYLLDLLSPIAEKCVGVVRGNHERAAEKFYERDIYWSICSRLADKAGIEPQDLALGTQGFVVLRFRRGVPTSYGGTRTINIYTHHGYGGGRLPGAHGLALGRVLGDFNCHIALLGHRHTKMVLPKTITSPGRGKQGCRREVRWGAFCGSYLDAYITPSTDKQPVDSYAEEKGLPSQDLGTIPIVIKPDIPLIEFRLASEGRTILEEEM